MKVLEQCCIAASKGNKILGLIMRNIIYKGKKLIIPLYKAIVRPHLECCIQTWRPYRSYYRYVTPFYYCYVTQFYYCYVTQFYYYHIHVLFECMSMISNNVFFPAVHSTMAQSASDSIKVRSLPPIVACSKYDTNQIYFITYIYYILLHTYILYYTYILYM